MVQKLKSGEVVDPHGIPFYDTGRYIDSRIPIAMVKKSVEVVK